MTNSERHFAISIRSEDEIIGMSPDKLVDGYRQFAGHRFDGGFPSAGRVTVDAVDFPLIRFISGLFLGPPGQLLAVRAEPRAAVGGFVVFRQAFPLSRLIINAYAA